MKEGDGGAIWSRRKVSWPPPRGASSPLALRSPPFPLLSSSLFSPPGTPSSPLASLSCLLSLLSLLLVLFIFSFPLFLTSLFDLLHPLFDAICFICPNSLHLIRVFSLVLRILILHLLSLTLAGNNST